MPPMVMTQEDRERLAARLIREERVRFSGIAKDAYTAAGVNPATWKRATEAQTIKPHKLIQIVANLWPETTGDWTLIPGLDLARPTEEPGRFARLLEDFIEEHPQITDAAIADVAGVDQPTVSRWRRQRLAELPLAETLQRLAEFIDVPYKVVSYAALYDARYLVEVEPDEPSSNTA